jgi:DNA-binding NtrC family response regulator
MRLLLVEDNACVRLAFTRLFTGAGFQVESCESAEAAGPLLERGGVDVALFDCRLPGRTGPDLAAECGRRWPGLPVILMSAEDAFRQVARAARPDAPFLRKPILPERLVEIVLRSVRYREAEDCFGVVTG